jgi:hypothetical protein
MKVRHLAPALAVSLAVALCGQPALAQHHGGGGRGGGGSHGGGGYAVHRGGGSPSHGTVAQARHPQAGTGHGYSYGHGGYYGHYGGHYGGHYRPYYGYGYGYGYYPYYRPYFYGSVYYGWPYYNYYGGPYYYGYGAPYVSLGYSYSPGYSAGVYAPPPADEGQPEPPPSDGAYSVPAPEGAEPEAMAPALGQLRLEVRPEDTSVYVDDQFRGSASQARLLRLPAGPHRIELVRPGYVTRQQEVQIRVGERSDVLVEMSRP